jgi:AcrR family transcriptional regulator
MEPLRDRRRQLLTEEIQQLALELFARDGYAQVTVDDIAAAAGISRRTFFRYFSAKEDVLVADRRVRAEQVQAALDARPPDEPVLTSLRHVLTDLARTLAAQRASLVLRESILATDPELRARVTGQLAPWTDALIRSVATRLRTDPNADVRPSLLVLATVAAFHAAQRVWLADEGADLVALFEEGADLVAGGLDAVDPVVSRRR